MNKEQENFLQLCICVLDLCGRICRDILLKFLPVQNCLGISRQLRLSRDQQRIVHNAVTTGNYDEFDITLVYTFLRNGCTNFPSPTAGWGNQPSGTSISDDVERIRILRNTAYGHVNTASIDTQNYNIHINKITDICQRMDTVHKSSIFNRGIPYKQSLQDILTNSTKDIDLQGMLDEMMLQIQIDLHTMEQNRDKQFEEIKQTLKREVRKLHCSVNDLRVAIALPSQKNDQALFLKERVLKALHHYTQSLYTKRRELEDFCIKKLRESPHLCILVGEKGSGKSSTALAVINNFSDSSFEKYLVYSPDELNVIQKTSAKDILILIDDIEGTSSNLHEKSRTIDRYSKELNATYRCQNFKLLITASCDVVTELQDLVNNLINIVSFDQILYLNKWPMTTEEKRETFNRYREVCCYNNSNGSQIDNKKPECPLSESEIEEIIQTDPPYGFPRACKMFFTNPTCLKSGIAFFRNTHDMLLRKIDERFPNKNENFEFLILCTVFFSKSVDFNEIIKMAKHFQMKNPDRMEVERAIRNLKTQDYIRKNETQGTQDISTSELFLAVLLAIGKYFPNILLHFSDRQLLFDLICSSSYDQGPDDICCRIPKDQDEYLARKLLDNGFDSLHHRTLTDETFCRKFVQEMFDKYGWNSTELEESQMQTLISVFRLACELSHLDNFLKIMILHLVQKEEQFSQILEESLFSCVYRGHIYKVLQFDVVSDDIRKNALIEAIKHQKEEIAIHYLTSLTSIFVKSLRISVQCSSPKIVEIILKRFKIKEDEILHCLSIAVDEGKADIVQAFHECNKNERMKGKEEKVIEILRRAIINHDIITFQCLIHAFLDLQISRELIFIQIVECGFSNGLIFFSDFFDLSVISYETLSQSFVKATRTEDNKFFETFCSIFGNKEIPPGVAFKVLRSAIEIHSIEKIRILICTIKFPNVSKEFHDIFLKASEAKEEILRVMLERFNVKRDTIYQCLHHTIIQGKFSNAKLIKAFSDRTDTDLPQEHVQQIFVDCCKNGDSGLIKGTIDLFGKGVIVDSSLQEGILLTLGSNETNTLEYLLREFDIPWLRDSVLRNFMYETCRCKPKSMEKLQLIIRHARTNHIHKATWERCVKESIEASNTDTCIYCLEMIGGNISESILMDLFALSFKLPNFEFVTFLLRNSYFEKLFEEHKGQVLISVFDSKNNDLMSYVISTFNKNCFAKKVAETIFTLLTEQGNMDILSKFINLIGTQGIPQELFLYSFELSIMNNYSNIPKFLSDCFDIVCDQAALNRMLMCSLDHKNVDNIELIAGTPELEFFENTIHRLVDVALDNIGVLRILCNYVDLKHIPKGKNIELLYLAIEECDNIVFGILLENCARHFLMSKKNDLFLNVINQGDKEMVEFFLRHVGPNIENDYIQLAFKIACQRDYSELLDFILHEEIFGTSGISEETLENAYRDAVKNDWKYSIEVMNRKFEIPTQLRKDCLMSAKSTSVVDELTKSKTGAGPLDSMLTNATRALVETGNPNAAKTLVEVQDKVKSAKDTVKNVVKKLFE